MVGGSGNTAAVNSVDLVARVQGFIQEISYTDGDFVKKDTLLFTIEPEPYRLKLLAAQAAEAGSQATLKQAEAEYKRQAELASKQFASQAVLDQAEATRDSARANLQQAQTNTQQAAINLGYTKVTAPFDGRVSARQVSLGQLVGASSPTVLATIVEEDPIYVDFTVSERDVLDGLVAGSPNKIIAFDLKISPRTVEIYRANVMTKMKAGSRRNRSYPFGSSCHSASLGSGSQIRSMRKPASARGSVRSRSGRR